MTKFTSLKTEPKTKRNQKGKLEIPFGLFFSLLNKYKYFNPSVGH